MFKHLLAAALMVAASASQAQVRVVESTPQGSRPGAAQPSATNDSTTMQAELYYQLQLLQQEVLELRGLMEEQAHEINRLKQQRLDDYVDLDRRIGALGGAPSGQSSGGSGSTVTPALTPSTAGNSEADVYRGAYDLLRNRQIDEAIAAFNAHLEQYPRGQLAGNSYYWLGEIYLLKNDLPQAREWFSRLLNDFPNDRKVPDAQFKLGRVYHQLGDDARARTLLQAAANSNSDAARLARQYLEQNF